MIFVYGGRVLDVWLALDRWLRAAWRTCPGDLLGRLVLRACRIDGPFRVGFAPDVSAILVEDPRAARYLDHQLMADSAQTLGRYVFARERLSAPTIAHELEHVRQWRRLGPLFLPLYGLSSGLALLRGRQPYEANAFEAAARQRAEADGAVDVRWLAASTTRPAAGGEVSER